MAAAALLAALGALSIRAGDDADDDDEEEAIELDEHDISFELNDTDGDLGIHARIDGEAWKKLAIEGPGDLELLAGSVKGRLRQQGLTEVFFESDGAELRRALARGILPPVPGGDLRDRGPDARRRQDRDRGRVNHPLAEPRRARACAGLSRVRSAGACPTSGSGEA